MFIHDIIKIEYVRQGYLPNYPYHLISDEEMCNAFLRHQLIVSQSDANRVIQNKNSLADNPHYFQVAYKLCSCQKDEYGNVMITGNLNQIEDFKSDTGLLNKSSLYPECFFAYTYPLVNDKLLDEYNILITSISTHLMNLLSEETELPDWIYSYMLGKVISSSSSDLDRHDLLVSLDLDNNDDEFTADACSACYEVSRRWIQKLPPSKRENRPPTMFGEPHVLKSLRIQSNSMSISS